MPPTLTTSDFTTPRAQRQLTLYLAGTTFLTLSTLLTRRAIHRKNLWPTPAFYTPSNAPAAVPVNGTVMAVEALQLATVNVCAFGMMVLGGVGWGCDVDFGEWRGRMGRRKRGGGDGEGDGGEEEGLKEWVGGLMGGRDGVVERARERRVREAGEKKEREAEGVIRAEEKAIGERRDGAGEGIAVVEDRISDQVSRPWWRPW